MFRQAEVKIEEFDSLALRTSIHVERKHALSHIGPLSQNKMPATLHAARANRQLS